MHLATVIIPNWNRRAGLEKLISSLGRQTQPVEEVIVVDNGSTDGSPEAAERAGARVLRFEKNLGFSRAVNAGLRAARTPLVAVLNNDVELAADYIERLWTAMEAEEAWFATGKLLDSARTRCIEGTFDTICRGGCSWRAGNGRSDSPEWNAPLRVRMVPFTAALFRRALFERVGLLDERFESYLEDVDFGLRCAREGYRGVYAPQAIARHVGSATYGTWHPETVRKISRNQVLLVAKHFPKRWVWRYGWPVLVAQGLWGVLALRHGGGWAYVRGKFEGLRRYRSMRVSDGCQSLDAILVESEREILDLQQRTGFDWYWRVYFTLT